MPAFSSILTDTLLFAEISFETVKVIVSPVILASLTGASFTKIAFTGMESGIVNTLSKVTKICPLPAVRAPIVPVSKSISYPLAILIPECSAENFTFEITDGFIVTVK